MLMQIDDDDNRFKFYRHVWQSNQARKYCMIGNEYWDSRDWGVVAALW